MKNFVLLFFILFVFSCSNKKEDTSDKNRIEDSIAADSEDFHDNEKHEYEFIDDSLASDPFTFQLDPISSLRLMDYDKIDTTTNINSHNDEQIDTSFTFTIGESKIEVLKLPESQIIISSDIRDRSIVLKKNINIGMTRSEFYKKFPQLDTVGKDYTFIRISIMDNDQWVNFRFENDTLNEIIFEGYFD